jgi:hypothetical protein
VTGDRPVCWGRPHRFTAERQQSGSIVLAEFLGDDAVAFRRCFAPSPTELADWLNHAWQAGQDFEVRQRDEYDTSSEAAGCPTCTGDCQCGDTVKEARTRFAPGGQGAVSRKAVTTTVYPAANGTTPKFPGGTTNGPPN